MSVFTAIPPRYQPDSCLVLSFTLLSSIRVLLSFKKRRRLKAPRTFCFQRVGRHLCFGYIYNPMDVERHFFRSGRRMLVAETVDIFAIGVRLD